ncbi:DUF1476 domain-containing protein [uncultured Jannaschia sp.]|uniref:DUF1476 domain-containing protein n=1 Tax=uncultured Jannaschia sp. TaxID=293347 RepID=UPI002634F12B|nr:DUF1476 domain-containing protein [uncultured Jannaschia sp.]
MASIDDRKKGFENKYAHDAELQFKVEARRNRLLGEWAAELLGKEGEEKTAYAREVVKSDFEEAGDDDVMRKVSGDLGEKVPAAEIRAKMDMLMEQAKQQVMQEQTT